MKTTQVADVKEPSEAHKMVDQFFAGKEAAEKGGKTGDEPTPPATPEPPKADAATPEPPTAAPTDESVETLKAALAAEQQKVTDLSAALTAAQTALNDENSETWKHKFDVLDGKIKKLGPEMKEQKKRIEELETELATAKTAKPAEVAPAPDAEGVITDAHKKRGDAWGIDAQEIADFEASIIKRVLASIPKPAETAPAKPEPPAAGPPAEPAQPVEPTASDQRKVAYNAFLTLVDVKAPGWRNAQKMPEFKDFCDTRPGGEFGQTYLEILKEADATQNADQTAKVYNAFMKTAKPAEASKKPSREAADSHTKGGSGAPVAVEIWTPEKIEQFSNDVTSGKIKRDSEEYKRLKASYDAWQANIKVTG